MFGFKIFSNIKYYVTKKKLPKMKIVIDRLKKYLIAYEIINNIPESAKNTKKEVFQYCQSQNSEKIPKSTSTKERFYFVSLCIIEINK